MIGIRIAIWFIFLIGIYSSMSETAGKIKKFLQFLYLFGSIYLLAWPIGVAFCELFLPPYYHHEAMTIINEGFHLLGIGFFCYLFGFPTSSYQKMQESEILPSQIKWSLILIKIICQSFFFFLYLRRFISLILGGVWEIYLSGG